VTWTPAQIQETVWSFVKNAYEARDLASETRSMLQLYQDGALNDELISDTVDFQSLMLQDGYSNILKEAGYGNQLDQLRQFQAEDTSTEGPSYQSLAPERDIERATRRLDAQFTEGIAEPVAADTEVPFDLTNPPPSDTIEDTLEDLDLSTINLTREVTVEGDSWQDDVVYEVRESAEVLKRRSEKRIGMLEQLAGCLSS
jgi:hypothetical protein